MPNRVFLGEGSPDEPSRFGPRPCIYRRIAAHPCVLDKTSISCCAYRKHVTYLFFKVTQVSIRWSSIAVVVSIIFSVAGTSRSGVAQETTQSEQRRASLVALAREHTLIAPSSGKEFPLIGTPVVHYTNPVRDRGTSDGVTMLWLDREMPIAVCSFSIRRPDDSLRFECTSFSGSPLECSRGGIVTWAPPCWQTAPQVLSGVPAPASLENRRLMQMRLLARQFQASCTRRTTKEEAQLRLMPQPLYRFRDAETGVIDGALFAFVISNDPELLLRMVAVKNGDTSVWKYSFARMTSLQVDVLLNDESVWQVPNFYEDGKSSTKPYIEGGLRPSEPSGEVN